MKKEIVPINTTVDGCAFTVTARYGNACERNLVGGGITTQCRQSKKSILMNAKNIEHGGYGDVAPTLCADYYKASTSHFIRYTNGFAYPAVMEIYEDSRTL